MRKPKFRIASKNANKHTARGLGALAASISTDGWIGAMTVAADGEAIAGSARLETVGRVMPDAAQIVVHSDGTRPIIVIRDDIANAAEAKAQRLALADNRIQELDINWDVDVLAGMPEDVLGDLWTGPEMSDLGQAWADAAEHGGHGEDAEDDEESSEETDAEDVAPVDRAEELQAKWQVQPGDIFAFGEHRLICGDCREPATWARLLAGQKANGVFTSPPYAEQRKAQYGGTPADKYVAWWEAVQANVRANLASDGSFFVNIKPHCADGERVLYVFDLVLAMKRQWGWRFVDEFAWVHGGTPMDVERRFKNGFEPVYQFANVNGFAFYPESVMHYSESVPGKYAEKQRGRIPTDVSQGVTGDIFANPNKTEGMAYPSNVVKVGKNTEALGQAAAFPVALPDFFVRAYSDAGDVWLDPFCGSGTTIVAAHKQGRIGLGIEQLPKYCAVICERMSNLGIVPKRIGQQP